MGRNRSRSERLGQLVDSARYEVLPTGGIVPEVLAHVPRGRTITVTASPRAGLSATLDVATQLSQEGYQVVPHLAARMVRGRGELAEMVGRLTEAGVQRVFVPGGDATSTEETYSSALELLEDLRELGDPFSEVGITGYPESHPEINDDVTVQAMWDKRLYATHVVSNLCPRPEIVVRWVNRLRLRGLQLPVYVGVPGPVDRTKLVSMATRIGVGQSARFLSGHRFMLSRLAAPGGFRPELFLRGLTPLLEHPDSAIAGVHMYTFNQVELTERWRRDSIARLGGIVT